jgi:hypothetical protein
VTFYDGMTVLGSRMLTNGQASMTTQLPAGGRALQAYYGGDVLHTPDLSAIFTQTVRPALQDAFRQAVQYPVGDFPMALVADDFNLNGRTDLVVANLGSNTMSLLVGTGTGTFSPVLAFPAGIRPSSVAVADFNNNSLPDLIFASNTSGQNSPKVVNLVEGILGSFLAPVPFTVSTQASDVVYSATVGDFNRDGHADLVVGYSNPERETVSVLLGTGAGTFQPPVAYPAGAAPWLAAVADFNGDGRADLAVTNRLHETVSVLLGNGNGSFQAPVAYATAPGGFPKKIVVGEFNGDGRVDLALTNVAPDNLSVLLGNGNGTFQPAVHYDTGAGTTPHAVAVGDINGDGRADLVSANINTDDVSVLLGNGNGTFQSAVHYPVGDGPHDLVVADFNGDGGADLAVANQSGDSVSILLGTAGASRVTVNTAPPALSITVDGTTYTSPQTFFWQPGTAHTLATSPLQPNGPGSAFAFVNWSDGGANSHTVITPSTTATYTATFTTQYLLDLAVLPIGGGTIITSPNSTSSYFNPGTPVQVTAIPAAGFRFTNFAGSLTGSANPQTITMNGPRSVVANFAPLTTSIAGTILSKSGLTTTRRWTIRLTNNGPGIALNTRITGFNLLQTFGPECTPNVTSPSAFPFAVGDIAPGASANAVITIDFRGCLSTNRYVVTIPYSANSGTVTGIIVRFNQFQ